MPKKQSFPKPSADVRRICILGGGVSGLSLAWYLLQKPGYQVFVFEKEDVAGGNARTMKIILDPKRPQRWADMGVNDYNIVSYKKLDALMKETGYGEGNKLEDTEAYGNTNGTVCYTNDGQLRTPMPADIAEANARFQKEAPQDCLLPQYKYYTVEQYVREKGYPESFIYSNLYARINGMYFCTGAPGELPFRAIMHYYMLQEGYESGKVPKPDRRYFRDGTMAWIDSLRIALNKQAGYPVVFTGDAARLEFSDDGMHIVHWNGQQIPCDQAVLAMHADDALNCFTDISKTPQDIIDVLVRFPYAPSTAVAHTDARALQPGAQSFRTYNIHVYDFAHDLYGPYTITYVGNRHQNDKVNPLYKDDCENPQFYISLNPTVWPAENCILKQPDGAPAIMRFKHQKISMDMLSAQERMLPQMQGRHNIWYCNGYALGAGLHEECLTLSAALAAQIRGEEAAEQIHYAEGDGANAASYAPHYIAHAHNKRYAPTTVHLTNQSNPKTKTAKNHGSNSSKKKQQTELTWKT